jgi:hypothetical protein
MIASEKRRVQYPRQMHVVHELRAARQQPRVFIPADGPTD